MTRPDLHENRDLCSPHRGSVFAALAALVVVGLAALPARAADTRVPLERLIAHADAVVLAVVGTPSTKQTRIALARADGSKARFPFVRYQRRLRVEQVLAAPRRQRAHLGRGAMVLVDEPRWRDQLAAAKQCARDQGCPEVRIETYASTLSHEPRSGQAVLVLLKRTALGWELAADLALDDVARADEARRLLAKRRGGER